MAVGQELDGANLNQTPGNCNLALAISVNRYRSGGAAAAAGRSGGAQTSVDQVVHLEDRQQHCKNDAHDEQAHKHNEQRAEQAHHGG